MTRLNILALIHFYQLKLFKMERKGIKTTTYSLDWDTVMNLESRLLRDFQTNKTKDRARALLMISIGVRLGMRVIDNLNLNGKIY